MQFRNMLSFEAEGLQFKEEKRFLGVFGKGRNKKDIVVVDQHQGPTLHAIGLNLKISHLAKRNKCIDVLVI